MMSFRSHIGFTLIEMVVVIAIIAILMALIFPVFSRVKEQGVRTSCIHNMRVISQGVMIYHQDHNAYPPMPGKMGLRGIPQGGVTGLNISALSIAESNLWCTRDTYPERLGRTDISRDQADSTYQYAYNDYGYVTTYDGLPFPVTTVEAANYFFGNPRAVDTNFNTYDPQNVASNWNLRLIDQKDNLPADVPQQFDVPRGLYQGLWNYRAPTDTIVTLCENHINGAGYPEIITAVTLGGEALMLRPGRSNASGSGYVSRKPSAANPVPAIDWRINKEAFSGKPVNMNYFGDSLGNNSASSMPLVEVSYRNFTADGNLRDSANDPANLSGYGFYDTGVQVEAGDYVMVVANAKWAWNANDKLLGTTFTDPKYMLLFNEQQKIFFTAEGDPVEIANGHPYPTMLYGPGPHCQLIGYIGDAANAAIDNDYVIPLGSRASMLIKQIPAGATPCTLKLTLNDTKGVSDYSDNVGWCEAWIAVFHPRPAP